MPDKQITKIKNTDAKLRGYLAKLAANVYEKYNQIGINPNVDKAKESAWLEKFGLNIQQVKKYHRFLFVFDPKKNYAENYQELFEHVFGKETAKQVYDELKELHPYGVEICINPLANKEHDLKAKTNPLIEHNSKLTADSILSAANMLLADLNKQQQGIIENYFINDEKIKNNELLVKRYEVVKQTIRDAYQDTIKIIDALYNEQFKSPEDEAKQYAKAERAIQKFHQIAIAQLASFSELNGIKRPSDKDYKKMYKLLGVYEQKTKFRGFYKETKEEDLEGDQFNRDIFALDIEEQSSTKVVKARIHYYDRKYNLTSQQSNHKNNTDNPNKSAGNELTVNPYIPQPTATAHSPDYLLSNSALVEEGVYEPNEDQDKQQTTINLFSARHGSPSPNEYYQKTLAKIEKDKAAKFDRHESTYHTFLNMEQHLQNLRTKVIEAILREAGFNKNPSLAARAISYELTKVSYEAKLNNLQFTSEELINEAFKNIKDNHLPADLVSELNVTIKLALNESADEIVNIASIHTHLITATGIGSSSEHQREQFFDASIAQYATQQGNSGYLYMSNGVNWARGDTFIFDASGKLYGNNCVAFLELAEILPKNESLTVFNKKAQIKYTQALAEVQKTSKAYMQAVEKHYIPTKEAYNQCNKEIKEKQSILAQLKKAKADKLGLVDKTTYKDLKDEIKVAKKNLATQADYLKKTKKNLDKLRKEFRKNEALLHKEAKALAKQTAKNIATNAEKIEALDKTGSAQAYLAYKAYSITAKLFVTNGWKAKKNNGVMQALINLTAEQMDTFSSYGCKSNNDRALLLAMIISELSKIADSKAGKKLEPQYLEKLLKNAQAAYAWHISREHTALDRSAIPKTGTDILNQAEKALAEYAAQQTNTTGSKIETHLKVKNMAAHARAKQAKTLVKDHMHSYSITNIINREYAEVFNKQWRFTVAGDDLKGITEKFENFVVQCAVAKDNGLIALEAARDAVRERQAKTFRNRDLDAAVIALDDKLAAWQFKIKLLNKNEISSKLPANDFNVAVNKTPEYKQLKSFLELLKEFAKEIKEDKKYYGKGWGEVNAILANLSLNDKTSLEDLLSCLSRLREVAHTRVDDFTQWAAARSLMFAEKRPIWLSELYKVLEDKDISKIVGGLNAGKLSEKVNEVVKDAAVLANYKEISKTSNVEEQLLQRHA